MNAKNIKSFLAFFLTLALFVVPASAAYSITATLETVQNSAGVNTWTTPISFPLNLTESKTMYGVTVNYADIGNANTLALFRITGGTSTDAALAKNAVACIKGNCQMNGTSPISIGDIRLTLTDIVLQAGTTSTTTNATTGLATSDNVVSVYLICSSGEKLPLNRNGVNNYDPSMCSAKTGWSTSADKELPLYIHRNFNIPTSIVVASKGNYNEKDLLDGGNTRPYILTSNDKYIFSVKTKRIDAWGGEIEETGTYTLTVKGLSATGTTITTPPQILGVWTVIMPETISLDIGETATFTPQAEVTVTQSVGNKYEFDFQTAGNYKIKYTTADGTDRHINFRAIEPTNKGEAQPTVTIQGNQQQAGGEEDNLLRYLMFGGGVMGMVLIGVLIFKRKPSTPKLHLNPQKTG